MLPPEAGWPWLAAPAGEHAGEHAGERGGEEMSVLARRAARLFATPDGEAVLGHLKEMTLDRCLSPEAGDGTLRHLEGQRHLVVHLLGLIRRGRAG